VSFARRLPRDLWLLAALLAIAVAPRLPSLTQPLLERHGFRQTWTAWTAQLFHERGVDLLHPIMPIFGPPFVLPSELPLFQALGALVMTLGVPTDPAMRVAGLLTFVACAVALWLLARDIADRTTAYVAVALFVATPLALIWSRTSMIEYLALAAALGYCWAGLRWRDGRGVRWWVVALVLGLIAALVKPPTFVGLAIPLALARDRGERAGVVAWLRTRLDPRVVALGLVPLAASYAWLAYGDAIKATEPAASFLQSTGALWRAYYYGTVADRLSAPLITRVSDELTDLAIGRYAIAFVVLGLVATLRGRRASIWAGVALSILLPIEIFWGAYTKHDYYFIAVTAGTALLGAAGIVWAWRRSGTRTAHAVVAAVVIAAVAGSLAYDAGFWTRMYEPSVDDLGIRAAARQIAAATRPDDLVLLVGYGYDPERLYYAQREGLMVTVENFDDALRGIPHERYRTLVVADPWRDAVWISRAWRWVGARESPIYRIADEPAGVADAFVVATDEPRALDGVSRGRVLASAPVTIPCDFAGADVPAGRQGTLLVLRSGYSLDARLSLGYVAGPVPARGAVWLDGAFTPTVDTVRVTCSGVASLTVDRVYDAPLDRR